jgi:hypothetical protein
VLLFVLPCNSCTSYTLLFVECLLGQCHCCVPSLQSILVIRPTPAECLFLLDCFLVRTAIAVEAPAMFLASRPLLAGSPAAVSATASSTATGQAQDSSVERSLEATARMLNAAVGQQGQQATTHLRQATALDVSEGTRNASVIPSPCDTPQRNSPTPAATHNVGWSAAPAFDSAVPGLSGSGCSLAGHRPCALCYLFNTAVVFCRHLFGSSFHRFLCLTHRRLASCCWVGSRV